jgi:2-hydroxymuconate-semialdehyde hydrolase
VRASRADPEVGITLEHAGFRTNYHDTGQGAPLLLLHGSGPGVTAWANWRLLLPALAEHRRVIAPDIVGFGYSDLLDGGVPTIETWVAHVTSLLDELGIDQVSLVGNSFGGALALWLATVHPERVDRLVLMGSVGAPFTLTAGLDAVWGYEPSVSAMETLLEVFVYDRGLLPSDLAESRYRATVRPGMQERWASLFPAPRQRWIDALSVPRERLTRITQPVLLVHGRDDQVIPLESSLYLLHAIDDAALHVWPHTGHWVQIERAPEFAALVLDFLGTSPLDRRT